MPELPEVETTKRLLEGSLIDHAIEELALRSPALRYPLPPELTTLAYNQKVNHISRRGKYILLHLTNGHTIIAHLGMSGRFSVTNHHDDEFAKHTHVAFYLNNGKRIDYIDPRRFGLMDIVETDNINTKSYFACMGYEPFDPAFTAQNWFDILQNKAKKRRIKDCLLDQAIIAGVGNIYACEALWMSGIHPMQLAASLSKPKTDILLENLRLILQRAIDKGGSTLRDYRQPDGDTGYFQFEFHVYGAEGKPCQAKNCQQTIQNLRIAGRSSFFCPGCQPLEEVS